MQTRESEREMNLFCLVTNAVGPTCVVTVFWCEYKKY